MSKTTSTMFFIYADWCGHCTVFKKNYWDSVKAATKKHLKVVEIESAKLEEFESKKSALYKKIFGEDPQIYFPMIVIFCSKGKRELYKGPMDNSLIKHVEKNYAPLLPKPVKKPSQVKKPSKVHKPDAKKPAPAHKPVNKSSEAKPLNIFDLKNKLETSLQMLKYI